jgi:hypothetical protein
LQIPPPALNEIELFDLLRKLDHLKHTIGIREACRINLSGVITSLYTQTSEPNRLC